MILTITLNPAVDISYRLDSLVNNGVNRCSDVIKTAGGKGLNATRVISLAKEDVCATGLLGGSNGQFIVDRLNKSNIKNDFMKIEGETRNCIAVLHEDNQTEILEPGPSISVDEKNNFIKKYEELVQDSDIVLASGSVPKDLGHDFYKVLIEICNRYNKKFLLDTSGNSLSSALVATPYLIKPNKDEITQLLQREVRSEEDVLNALIELNKYSIPYIIVSLGADGAMALCNKKVYRVTPHKIKAVNPVGSGDSTIAGFAIAIQRKFETQDLLRYGCTLGTLNALEQQTGYVNMDLVDEFMEKTKVEILREI